MRGALATAAKALSSFGAVGFVGGALAGFLSELTLGTTVACAALAGLCATWLALARLAPLRRAEESLRRLANGETVEPLHSPWWCCCGRGLTARLNEAVVAVEQRARRAQRRYARLARRMHARSRELQRQASARRRANAELRKLALVASRTTNAVIIAGADRRIEWVNAGFTRLTGYDAHEAIGRSPGDLLHGPNTDAETVEFMRSELRRGRGFRVEIVNYAKDGREYWVDLEVQPVYGEGGALQQWMAIESDVTARKLAGRELRTSAEMLQQMNHELERARDAAETANQAKSAFLANMSHEIRTPMSAILGYADLLLDAEQDEVSRDDAVRTIRRNGEHLLKVINDILDLSKIEAGEMMLESTPCRPRALAEEVVALLRPAAEEKGLRLTIESAVSGEAVILTDSTRLRQIWLNLLGNAVKFTETGAVVLGLRISAGESAPALEFEVRDTGIGMDAAQAQRLFCAFGQADASMTRRFGGTGLGLVISQRLARLLGGDVFLATSEPRVGTVFRGRIAAQESDASANDACGVPLVKLETPAAKQPRRQLADARILLAEDGPDNQRLISCVLRRAGAIVTVVGNGQLALDAVAARRRAGEPFDLVLMDMQMPELDGYAAAEALRASGDETAIVALTAHAMIGDREKCLAAGCNDYLTKPIDVAALIERCAHWRRQAHQCAAMSRAD